MRKKMTKFIFLTAIFILFASAIFALTPKIIVVAPGESFTTGSGKSGTPLPQTAGVYFNVTVYTIDQDTWQYYNNGGSQQASMTASNVNVTFQPQRPVINQTVSSTQDCAYYPVSTLASTSIGSSQYVTITSQDGSSVGYTPITASNSIIHIFDIASYAFTTITTQTVTTQAVSNPIQVTITAYDSNGATVTSFNGQANLTAYYTGGNGDATVSLGAINFTNGKYIGSFTLAQSTASGETVYIQCSSTTPPISSNNISNRFSVNPGAFYQLLIIGPGQTFAPGNQLLNGRVGGSTQTNTEMAGVPFYVTVYACDENWNNITGNSSWVTMTSTDSTYTTSSFALVAGFKIVPITLDTVGALAQQSLISQSISVTSNTDFVPMTYNSLASFAFQQIGTQSASQAFRVSITALDAYGNTVGNFSNSVNLTALSGGVAMSSGQWSPTSVTFANGIWQGNVIIRRISVQATLQASYSGTTGTSNIFQVNAGVETKIVVTGPSTAVAGNPVLMNVYVSDANGNTVATGAGSSDIIQITSTDALATIGGQALPQYVTLSGGVGSFNIVMGTVGTGPQTITGTDKTTSLTTGNANISVTPGTMSSVVFSNIGNQTAGIAVSGGITITTEDKYGNATPYSGLLYVSSPLTDWTNPNATTISITAGGNNNVFFVQQEYAVSFTSQSSAVVGCTFHRATYPQSISIFASTLITDAFSSTPTGHLGWSNSFTVSTGASFQLQVLVPGMNARPGTATGYYGQPTAEGVSVPITVTVNMVDSWYNITSSTDLISLDTTDDTHAGSSPPVGLPISGPIGTYYIYDAQPSSDFQIIAADSSHPVTIAQGETPYITIFNISQLIVSVPTVGTQTVDQMAGVAFYITITAYSAYPVTATTFNGTVNLASSTNYSASLYVISPTISAQFVNGVCGMWITVYKADSTYITGKQVLLEATLGNVTTYSNPINVVPNVGTKIMILADGMSPEPGLYAVGIPGYAGYSGSPNTEIAGRAFPIVVQIVDAYYNGVTTVSNTITINSTDTQAQITDIGTLPQSNIPITNGYFTDANMVLKTVGANGFQTITVQDSNVSIGSNTTPNIYLQHAALAGFTVAAPPGPILAGQSFNINVTAVDAYGNTLDNGQGATAFPANDPVTLNAITGANTIYPLQTFLSNGTIQVLVTLYASGLDTITASWGGKSGTSLGTQINANVFYRLWIEGLGMAQNPGVYSFVPPSAYGYSDFLMYIGMPVTRSVNDNSNSPSGWPFEVYAVDEYGNLTTTGADNIQLITNDPYAIPVTITPISGDVAPFLVIFHTAMAGVSVSAIDLSNPAILGFTTPGFPTTAGAPYGLQIVPPGEYVLAGSGGIGAYGLWNNGVTGVADAQITGTYFPVSVLACDQFGNFTSGDNNDVVEVTCTDLSPAIPNTGTPLFVTVEAGITTFTARLITAHSSQVITLDDYTNSVTMNHNPLSFASIRVIQSSDLVYKIIVNGVSNVTGTESVTVTAYPATFNVEVELVDGVSGLPVSGLNDAFGLYPVLASNLNAQGHGTLGVQLGQFPPGFQGAVWQITGTAGETYTDSESIRIFVSDQTNTNVDSAYSCKIIVGANPATATFTLTANPPNIRANTSSVISAHLVDGNGNPIVGQTVNFYISQGTGSLSTSTASTTAQYGGGYQDAFG